MRRCDAIIVGGGFFGTSLAIQLRRWGMDVLLLERESDILRRASAFNQARIHNGYHYPRSLQTALRSHVNFAKFATDYADCVVSDFAKYYAISRIFSHVTSSQFQTFCQRIGAPLEPAEPSLRDRFNPQWIEDVFRVQEYAFDVDKLRARTFALLREWQVELWLGSAAKRVISKGPHLDVDVAGRVNGKVQTRWVFNCTYSGINPVLHSSDLAIIPMKHELTEMVLVDTPDWLKHVGITVMCGPFFSIMPFPSRGLHSLSHVRYTPHAAWRDDSTQMRNAYDVLAEVRGPSHWVPMIQDAMRYVPSLKDCRYVESLREVKTVLPSSESNDSRPILFQRHAQMENLFCVMGGKIDNVYEMLDEVSEMKARGELS